MPKSKYRGRGRILRHRRKSLNHSYLNIAVMSKKGKMGGRTIATHHKRKTRRRGHRRRI